MNTQNKSCAIVVLLVATTVILPNQIASAQDLILRVDVENVTSTGDGSGWEQDAIRFLQDALVSAETHLSQFPNDTVDIWVAQGVYLPDHDSENYPDGTCYEFDPGFFDCSTWLTFTIPDNVRIFGGFTGDGTETSLDERNGGVHDPTLTILSGDLANNDSPTGPGCCAANSEHVVTFQNTSHNARLDTVTVLGASAGGGTDAGVRINSSDAIISNCIIRNNWSAGVRVHGISNPRIINCQFMDNVMNADGALTIQSGTNTTVVNSLFHNNNTTSGDGAAIQINGNFGSGCKDCPPTVVDLINLTITGNHASGSDGSGGGVFVTETATTSIKNTILWDNTDSTGSTETAQIHDGGSGTLSVTYSCIQNLDEYDGYENIGGDPSVFDPEFVAPQQGNYRLEETSPCVNAGDIDTTPAVPVDDIDIDVDGITEEYAPDLDLQFRTVNLLVDMGAYESQVWCDLPGPDCTGNGLSDACDILLGHSDDCNGNGIPDECDLADDPSLDCNNSGKLDVCEITDDPSLDCNGSGKLDECEIADDPSLDCNGNGIIDTCEIDCDGTVICDDNDCSVEIVFILDTSGSMSGELQDICANVIEPLAQHLQNQTVDFELQILMLAGASASFPCLGTTWPSVNQHFNSENPTTVPVHDDVDPYACITELPNGPIGGAAGEAWATATSIVADQYSWSADSRLIVPISDEAPCQGGTTCNSADGHSIENAIAWASEIGIGVVPITGEGTPSCVVGHANNLAQATTGTNAIHRDDYASDDQYVQVGAALISGIDEFLPLCLVCCDHGPCPGDLDDDGEVDINDLFILLAEWGTCADPNNCPADLDCDGEVDVDDLFILLGNWGDTCSTGVQEIAPQTIEDCYEKYPDEEDLSLLLDCIFAVEQMQQYIEGE